MESSITKSSYYMPLKKKTRKSTKKNKSQMINKAFIDGITSESPYNTHCNYSGVRFRVSGRESERKIGHVLLCIIEDHSAMYPAGTGFLLPQFRFLYAARSKKILRP